jgi:transcription antitermination factor NusA-like protein
MQLPLCEVCSKSEILCNSCQDKLDKGIITEDDVTVSRFLYNMSEKMKSIRDIKISKVIDCEVLLIITGRGDAAKLVGKGGSVVKKIAKKFKKSIRILEEAPNFKEFVEELIFPAPVNGINTLYRDNQEIMRIRIPAVQKNHLLISPENFSQLISDFYNLKAEIIFEG